MLVTKEYSNTKIPYIFVWALLSLHTLHCTDATVAQVAIAWLLAQPTVTSVVLGARNKQQLADNLASVNVELTNEEVSVLLLSVVLNGFSFLR